MVRRSGRAASRRPDPPASVLGGKNLCREVRSYAHNEAVAVTSGTEASPIAAIRMDGLRVPTGRAKTIVIVVSLRDALLHWPRASASGRLAR
jgi:hypothetical protein